MNKQYHNYNQNTYRILYYRYKKYIVPSATIVVSIALFFFLVLPQVQELQGLKDTYAQKKAATDIIDKNITQLNGIDETELSDQVEAETTALPSDKDFAGMLTAVTTAAPAANVKLADFGFTVGDLSTESAKLSDQLAIQMKLSVDGGLDGAKRYISVLSKRLPLNEIITENTSGDTSDIQVSFFYRPFQQESNDGTTAPIPQMSADAKKQVDTIKEWIKTAEEQSSQNASPSGSQ
jgi:hypothetical protein